MSLDFYLEFDVDTGAGVEGFRVYERNITHNLVPMWKAAGCYHALYERDGSLASEIVDVCDAALIVMLHNPEKFKAMEPSNGWGRFENATDFLSEIISQCSKYPKATIRIRR